MKKIILSSLVAVALATTGASALSMDSIKDSVSSMSDSVTKSTKDLYNKAVGTDEKAKETVAETKKEAVADTKADTKAETKKEAVADTKAEDVAASKAKDVAVTDTATKAVTDTATKVLVK